jgi:hypothetical protein
VIAKRKGVSARRGLKEAWRQRREPMNKNRIATVSDEFARYNEVQIHQGHRLVNPAVVR